MINLTQEWRLLFMVWTPEKEAELIECYYTLVHIKEIARAMGLRENQVMGKIKNMRKYGMLPK